MPIRSLFPFTIAAACLCPAGLAQDAAPEPPPADQPIDPQTGRVRPITFGDAAPRLKVEKWVQGSAPEAFEPGTVSVVWFFATWSAPAAKAIPEIRELHTAFKDQGVRVIGIAMWEGTKPAENGTLADRVAAFVAEHGAEMPYAVGFDGERGEMAQTWMRAGDRRWIPTAFVIDKAGKVAWMGHPLGGPDRLSDVVSQVLKGEYDVKAASARAAAAKDLADRIRKMNQQWRKSMDAGDGKQAMKRIDELIAAGAPDVTDQVVETFTMVLVRNRDATAYPWARALAEGALKDHDVALNNMAWAIVDTEGLEMRDLPVALALATRAYEVSKGEKAFIIDTLARVEFERGEYDRAIELQGKAMEKAEPGQKDEYRAVMERYKAAKAAAGK